MRVSTPSRPRMIAVTKELIVRSQGVGPPILLLLMDGHLIGHVTVELLLSCRAVCLDRVEGLVLSATVEPVGA